MTRTRSAILAAFTSVAALCAGASTLAAEIRISVACPATEACTDWVWAVDFAEHLNEAGVETRLYVGGALGRDPEVVEQLAQGLLQVGLTNFVMIAEVDPRIRGFLAPYMFDSLEHLFRALDETEIVSQLDESMQGIGVRIGSLIGFGGPIGIFNNQRPVESVADLEGLRLRAIDRTQVAVIEEWGASSVVIDMAEFTTSLQQGIAHGYVNPPMVPLMFQHTESLNYFTNAEAGMPVRSVLISNDWYEGLSEEERGHVDAAIAYANDRNRDLTFAAAEREISQLLELGVTVTELTPEARAEFVERSEASWPRLLDEAALQMFIEAAAQTRR